MTQHQLEWIPQMAARENKFVRTFFCNPFLLEENGQKKEAFTIVFLHLQNKKKKNEKDVTPTISSFQLHTKYYLQKAWSQSSNC